MAHVDYRPAQRLRGRRLLMGFEVVNTFSFALLAGNLIILLLLRLGANSTLIGILSAFPYLAFFFMPLARGSVVKHGLVRTFGRSWTARYAVVVPIILAPLFVVWGQPGAGIALVMASYFLFQVMRGFGLVSISPLNNELSAGKDRGEFLSRKMMVTYASSISAGLLVGAFLGPEAPIERYSLFMGIGVVLGFIGCSLIYRIPEPPGASFAAREPFVADVRRAWADPDYRRFVLAIGAMFFVSSLSRPFLVVYAKQACHFGDDAAMILTVIGNLGAIAMGWLCRMVLDRMGAKPLLVIFALLSAAVALPLAVLAPPEGLVAWLSLSALFFLGTFAAVGGENAGQAWFFAKTSPDQQFNLGMSYYMVMGFTGAVGSFLGGTLLDGSLHLSAVLGFDGTAGRSATAWGFNAFFGLAALLGVPVIVLLSRIAPLGAKPVADTLGTIFNPRELVTISLLRRLDSPSGIEDEERMLARIRETDSDLAVDEVLKRLGSPLFAIRNQALLILERLPATREVEDALIDQVRNHQFSSAARAARLLGQKGVARAVPALRAALGSGDYFLQAWAASALGELEDRDSRPALEDLLTSTENTLVLIHSIAALKRLACPESYPVVVAVLARREVPAQLRDEVVFGLAGIAGFSDWLYPKYLAFLEDARRGADHLIDEIEAARKEGGNDGDADALIALVEAVVPGAGFAGLADAALGALADSGRLDPTVAAETRAALGNESIRDFIRFRYFSAALAVHAFRSEPRSMSR